MKQYVGKDIREVVLDSGPPVSAMDMGEGSRAFQFRWGGGTYVLPQTTTGTGTARTVGNTTWFEGRAITTPGGVVHSEGCVITYMTTWDAQRNAWVVTGYRVPKQLVC